MNLYSDYRQSTETFLLRSRIGVERISPPGCPMTHARESVHLLHSGTTRSKDQPLLSYGAYAAAAHTQFLLFLSIVLFFFLFLHSLAANEAKDKKKKKQKKKKKKNSLVCRVRLGVERTRGVRGPRDLLLTLSVLHFRIEEENLLTSSSFIICFLLLFLSLFLIVMG